MTGGGWTDEGRFPAAVPQPHFLGGFSGGTGFANKYLTNAGSAED
jgi:hypothetical protein